MDHILVLVERSITAKLVLYQNMKLFPLLEDPNIVVWLISSNTLIYNETLGELFWQRKLMFYK